MGFDAAALSIIIVVAVFLPRRWFYPWMTKPLSVCKKIAGRPWGAVLFVGLVAFGGCAAYASLLKRPVPWAHDEFGYLLAADTFAHGRLTNPPHPLGIHFESFHILQWPTYMSKYPPAQGLLLAAGQVLTGDPLVGVWLSVAWAAAGVCWMLQAWVPPRWAFLGGLLAALRMTLPDTEWINFRGIGYWGNGYWGGAVAAWGGTLVFGSLRRIISLQGASGTLQSCMLSITLGCGLAILANSRPFEGLVISLPPAVLLLCWMTRRSGPPFAVVLKLVIIPVVIVLAIAGSWMAYYNERVTGDPWKMPFQVHEETYRVAPLFLWQQPRPVPEYHHEVLRTLHAQEMTADFVQQQTLLGFLKLTWFKIRNLFAAYFGWLLIAPLIALPWAVRERWTRFAFATCLALVLALLFETWFLPHYAAPMTGLLFLLEIESLRRLSAFRRPRGRFVAKAIPMACLAAWLFAFYDLRQQPMLFELDWHFERAKIEAELSHGPEKHLVIVRYDPSHSTLQEWVYNRAEIDQAPVVWAREMETEQTEKLRNYFRDRQHWRLVPEGPQAGLQPLAPQER